MHLHTEQTDYERQRGHDSGGQPDVTDVRGDAHRQRDVPAHVQQYADQGDDESAHLQMKCLGQERNRLKS